MEVEDISPPPSPPLPRGGMEIWIGFMYNMVENFAVCLGMKKVREGLEVIDNSKERGG